MEPMNATDQIAAEAWHQWMAAVVMNNASEERYKAITKSAIEKADTLAYIRGRNAERAAAHASEDLPTTKKEVKLE